MKREIKFRAWDNKRKKWYLIPSDIKMLLGYTSLRHDNIELSQYTGLKDKNGKEIYEGDIFAEQRVGKEDEPFAKVVFDTDLASFCVEKSNGGWVYLDTFLKEERHASIIGNIYENPELLKDK